MPKFVNNIDLPEYAAKPVYAGVGATDLAVEKVREAVTDAQSKVTATVTEFRNDVTERVTGVQKVVQGLEPKTLQVKAVDTAKARRGEVEQRFTALQSDAKELPAKVQADVKNRVDENVATVTGFYADLAKRGEGVVGRIRGAQVEAERAQQGTSTQKPAQKSTQASTAQKAPAKRTAAKKSTAKKSTAKKSTAKKSTAQKSTAQKSTSQTSTQSSAAKKA